MHAAFIGADQAIISYEKHPERHWSNEALWNPITISNPKTFRAPLPTVAIRLTLLAMHAIDEYNDERCPLLRSEHEVPEPNDSEAAQNEQKSTISVALTVTIAVFGTLQNQ